MKVKALLIGINDYPAQVGPLNGCENDARNLLGYLKRLHPQLEAKVILSKDATFANIAKGYEWLAAGDAQLRIATMSSHGTTTPDTNHDETQYKVDQSLVSVSGKLIEDDRNGYWASLMPENSVFVQFVDACFAGGGERLNADFTNRAIPYERVADKQGIDERGWWQQLLDMLRGRTQPVTTASRFTATPVPKYKPNPNHIYIPASQQYLTAADAYIDGQYQGAGTWALLTVLARRPQIKYVELADAVNAELGRKMFPQRISVFVVSEELLNRPVFQ